MSGVATAWFLMKGDQSPFRTEGEGKGKIVLLEAREFCSGATGRNGGHCRPDSYLGYPEYKHHFGKEQALKIVGNELATLNLVEEIVKEEGVQCDFWRGKGMDVFLSESIKEKGKQALADYVQDGGPINVNWIDDPKEAQEASRVKGAVGAATYPAGSLYPFKLVSHLFQQCLDLGLKFQNLTPVTSVTRADQSDGWSVNTTRGSIKTRMVVHCTNAFAGSLLEELVPAIVPMRGHCTAWTPTKSYSGRNMLQTTQILCYGQGGPTSDDEDAFDYLIQRPSDGTIIIGGGSGGAVTSNPDSFGNTDDTTCAEGVAEYLSKRMPTLYEGWGPESLGEGLQRTWTGVMGYSKDALPYVGAVPGRPGQFINAGHHGHGMARIATCARGLAKLILGKDQEDWSVTDLPEAFQWTSERLGRTPWAFTL